MDPESGIGGISAELPLSETGDGWRVEIVSYRINGRQAGRLAELGLTPGTPVRILRNAQGQPLLVYVRETHLAIDRETARMLNVRLLDRPERDGHRRRDWRKRVNRRGNDLWGRKGLDR